MKSFYAPYLCEHCKTSFQAIIDAYAHREAIETRTPPSMPCPTCQRKATYDGELDAFVAAAEKISPASDRLPPSAAFDPKAPKLERHNEGNTTRVALVGELSASVRWRNVLDGLGEVLVVDLTRTTAVASGGISPLITALRSITVTSIEITSCPIPLADGLRGSGIESLKVRSIAVDGLCPKCNQTRRATIEVAEGSWERTVTTKVTKSATCPKCGTPLKLPTSGGEIPQRTLPFGLALGVGSALALVGLVVVVVGIVMAGIGGGADEGMPGAGAGDDQESPGEKSMSDRLKLDAEQVSATGHGGPYASATEAEAAARDKALGVIISAIAREISTKRGISAGAIEVSPAEVAKFLEALSLDPSTLRVDGQVKEGEGGYEVDARYALPRAKFDGIVSDYATERDWEGMKLVRPFPPAQGLRVVESEIADLEPGSRIVRIGETTLSGFGDLPSSGMVQELVVQEPDGTERNVQIKR